MDTVPGADTLGFGFNITKSYDDKSTTQRIFNEGQRDASQITVGETVYAVPANVAVAIKAESDTTAKAFSTREQVQSYFSSKAGITVSAFGFEGQFEAAYSFTSSSDKSYSYGLVDGWTHAFTVKLKQQGREMFTDDFSIDLDSLPEKFSKESEEEYFAFFDAYGTHFVHQVTLGGSLYYYVAVQKTYESSEEEMRAKIDAEYKAVFAKTKVEAEAEWKKVGKQWTENRIVHLHTVGGDSSIEGLTPVFGDWKGDFLQKWNKSLSNRPGQTGFSLQPISKVAPLKKRKAMEDALRAYLRAGVIVKAERIVTPQDPRRKYTAYPTIDVPHGPVTPQPPLPYPARREDDVDGMQLVLLHPDTFEVIFSRAYYLNPSTIDNVRKMYADLLADVRGVEASDYYCALSVFGLSPIFYPPPEVAAWLGNCGAALARWKEYIGATSSASGAICYTFAGRRNMRHGQEDFRFDLNRSLRNLDSTTKHFLRGSGVLLTEPELEPQLVPELEPAYA
jgi:hypothetical protein